MAILQAGYNVVINQKVGGTNTPIYPFTKTANVVNAAGDNLDTVISGLAVADHGNHVPDFSSETKDGLRFLNNDNTWQQFNLLVQLKPVLFNYLMLLI